MDKLLKIDNMKKINLLLTAIAIFGLTTATFGQNPLVCDSMSTLNGQIHAVPYQDTIYFGYDYNGPNSGVQGGIYIGQFISISDTSIIESIELLDSEVPFLATYVYSNQNYPLLIHYTGTPLPPNYTLNCNYEVHVGVSRDTCIIPFTLIFNQSINVPNEQLNNAFSVYPNPTKNQINVKVDATLLGSAYTVYDNMGKSVLTGKIYSQNTIIELDVLLRGVYLLSIGENLKQAFKVVKE